MSDREEKKQVSLYIKDVAVLGALAKLRVETQADTVRYALKQAFGNRYEAMMQLVESGDIKEEESEPEMQRSVA